MFSHPVDIGVMLALSDTLLFLFGAYDNNKSKNLQKNLFLEEGKAFFQSLGSLKQVPYIFHLDLFSGITKVPKEVISSKICPKLGVSEPEMGPLEHLLSTFISLPNTSSALNWNPGYELFAIHPLTTLIYEGIYREVLPYLIDSLKESLKGRVQIIRYFSDILITIEAGSLYGDLQETGEAAMKQLQLPYEKTWSRAIN